MFTLERGKISEFLASVKFFGLNRHFSCSTTSYSCQLFGTEYVQLNCMSNFSVAKISNFRAIQFLGNEIRSQSLVRRRPSANSEFLLALSEGPKYLKTMWLNDFPITIIILN